MFLEYEPDDAGLLPHEAVCPVHRTTYNRALGECPEADEHNFKERLS
jgi:nitrite reductase/ring-hydroxylating ferredoxin subunit